MVFGWHWPAVAVEMLPNSHSGVVRNRTIVVTQELRQYKNDSTQSRNFLVLKLTRFFVTYVANEKARQFQN